MRALAALSFAFTLCLALVARGDDPAKRAQAIALFDEARGLMQRGDYASACPKLEEAQRLSPGLGILYNLSDCYEHVGKLASAWAGFRQVAALAASGGQADRERDARRRAETLEPRLPRLQIDVTRSPDLRVMRNGVVVSEAQWGTPVPVDLARYHIRAEAPGKTPWESDVVVEREAETTRVTVPALSDAPSATPAPIGAPVPPPPPPPSDEETPAWQAPLGITLFAVGAAALVAGGVVAGVAKNTADDADCDEADLCSAEGVADRDRALTMGNAATGLIIGGAVVGAAGLVVWLTSPAILQGSGRSRIVVGFGHAALHTAW